MTAALLQESAAHDHARATGILLDFITFRLEGRSYALPLVSVAEIVRFRELNRMPHMPRTVEGLLDLRGEVVPVVNLRTRLGLPSAEHLESCFILVVGLVGSKVGLLVDALESVVHAKAEEVVHSSRLLSGPEGAWVSSFIVRGATVLPQLDPIRVAAMGTARTRASDIASDLSLEERMDDSLRSLVEMAPTKEFLDPKRKIIPQIEESIRFTEEEVDRVVRKVEGMLGGADQAFQALTFLKQEVGLGHLKGYESTVADLERTLQSIQDKVFDLLGTLQFQDIARQKLERILNHLHGLQGLLTMKLRDEGKHE